MQQIDEKVDMLLGIGYSWVVGVEEILLHQDKMSFFNVLYSPCLSKVNAVLIKLLVELFPSSTRFVFLFTLVNPRQFYL